MGSSPRSRRFIVLPLVVVAIAGCGSLGAPRVGREGIQVGADGRLLRDGKPYRAFGVNYFNAFSRTLENPADTSYREGFDVLREKGIPFIRFMAGGYYPIDMKRYREDKEGYFRLMDAFVRAAEEKGIGLVPSLFWWMPCTPDMAGEPCNRWGDPSSKTVALMREYVNDVVGRYAKSPAIWAWELGNEYSLSADLLNNPEWRPATPSERGTPAFRTAEDDLTHDMIVSACREFGKAVRARDPWHPITTGHSLPRSSAQHLRMEHSWTKDSPEDLVANLIDVTPDPVNMISVHVYPEVPCDRFGGQTLDYSQVYRLCLEASRRCRKALFVGEFGASDRKEDSGPEGARRQFGASLAALESTGVQLAALWVFDFPPHDSFVNVTATNQRSYMLDALAEANARLRKAEGR